MQGGGRDIQGNAENDNSDDQADSKRSSLLPRTAAINIQGDPIENTPDDIVSNPTIAKQTRRDPMHPVVATAHLLVDFSARQNVTGKSVVSSNYRYASQDDAHMFPTYKDQVHDVIYDDISAESFIPSLVRPQDQPTTETMVPYDLDNAAVKLFTNDNGPDNTLDVVSASNPPNVEFGDADETTEHTAVTPSLKLCSRTVQQKHLIRILFIILLTTLVLAILLLVV